MGKLYVKENMKGEETERQRPQHRFLMLLGMLGVLVGISLYLLTDYQFMGKYLFAGGALLLLIYRFLCRIAVGSRQVSLTERRLLNIFVFSGLVLAGAAYSLLAGTQHWKGLLLIVALLDAYVSFRNARLL